ncbi:hypothetical protein BSL78_19129 [Apostichopus japonicus]|uniref:SOCS box domain-containing protein n=1 Tax=Stichopus japonicus TaxID=307972 RepID=A0A2G8K7L2_STIJA|nr:hypothetical protein BSL78_19129 [Apostichopus japonicus]
MKPTQNTKVTSWGSSSCDVDSHGQLTMVIDLARAYGVKRRDLQSVSLTTDCVFPPYDDSRLVTCISIQGVSPAARRVWIRSAVLLMEDAITIWNMNGHKRPTCGGPIIHDQKALLTIRKRNNWPVAASVRPSQDARFLCYPDSNHLEFRHVRNSSYVFVRDAIFKRSNYYKCISISPDDTRAAGIIAVNGDANLFVCCTDVFYLYWTRSCLKLFPRLAELGSLNNNTDMSCAFSPDGALIVVTTGTGAMFLVSRFTLRLVLGVLPRKKSDQNLLLCCASAFDFHPLVSVGLIACCTSDKSLALFSVSSDRFTRMVPYEDTVGSPTIVRFNALGTKVAVAGDNSHIVIHDAQNLSVQMAVDTTIPCPRCAIKIPTHSPGNSSRRQTTFLSVSFSHDSLHMAASSTDGLVRVWKLPTVQSLLQLCRLAIIKVTPIHKIYKLPLPDVLKGLIVCKPTERASPN